MQKALMLIQIGASIIGIGLLICFCTSVFGRIKSKRFGLGFPEGKSLVVYNWGLLITIIFLTIGSGIMVIGKKSLQQPDQHTHE